MSRITSLSGLEALALSAKKQTIALAAAESEEALLAVDNARQKGIADAILVGDKRQIVACAEKHGIDLGAYEIVDVPDCAMAAAKAVELIREGRAQLLMKGLVETGDFLRAVLNSASGLKTKQRLCSVVALECKAINRIIVLADVGTNVAPNVEEKASILESCFVVARAMGMENPKAAVLCAQEKVQPEAMPVSAEGALLSKMAERGQIKGGIVEGPISMDIAVSKHASDVKRFGGKIQGDADILVVPDLQSGNILIKGLMYLSGDVKVAGVGMGAKVPLILTSRGDDHDTKYYSIVLAVLISQSGLAG